MSLPTELIHACFVYVVEDIHEADDAAREKCVSRTLKSISTVCRAWRHAAWPMILDRSLPIVTEEEDLSRLLVPFTADNVKQVALFDNAFLGASETTVFGLLDSLKQCPRLRRLLLYMEWPDPWRLSTGDIATIDADQLPESLATVLIESHCGQPLTKIATILSYFTQTVALELVLSSANGSEYTERSDDEDESDIQPISLPKLTRIVVKTHTTAVDYTLLSSLFSTSTLGQIKDITIDNALMLYDEIVQDAVKLNLETLKVTSGRHEMEEFWRDFVQTYHKIKHVDLVGAGFRANVFLSEVLSSQCPRTIETIRFAAEPGEIFDIELPFPADALSPNLRTIEMVHEVEQDQAFDEEQFLEMARPVIEELERRGITLSMTVIRLGVAPQQQPVVIQQHQQEPGADQQEPLEEAGAVVGPPQQQGQEPQEQQAQGQEQQGQALVVQPEVP